MISPAANIIARCCARRQPGSAFKPIIYATAMNQGMSPATVVLDAPVVYEQEEEDKTWKPENYGKRFHGIVSLREALIHSHNLATVRLLDKVGIRNVIDFSRTVGIVSPLAADLSLALGLVQCGTHGAGVGLWRLCQPGHARRTLCGGERAGQRWPHAGSDGRAASASRLP